MKLLGYAMPLGMILGGVDAAYLDLGIRAADPCYQAVATPSNDKQHTSDCKSFLVTTVRPRTTIYRTITRTDKKPTVTKSITVTSTSLVTAIQTSSVVQTVIDDVTVTEVDDHTMTVAEDVTETITEEGPSDPPPPFKRAAASVPGVPAYLNGICTNSAQYSSACSRIGVTARTVTEPRVVVVEDIFLVKVPRATTVKTTVATAWVTSTVQTTVVLETYSTKEITETVDVVTEDVTVATKVVTDVSTETQTTGALATIQLTGSGSDDPGLPSGIDFYAVGLEPISGSTSDYYVSFSGDYDVATFTLNEATGELKLEPGSPGSAGGSAYVDWNSSGVPGGEVIIRPTADGAPRLVCKITTDNDGDDLLECEFGNGVADFWTCAQRLVVVESGFDFTHQCTDAAKAYKMDTIAVQRM